MAVRHRTVTTALVLVAWLFATGCAAPAERLTLVSERPIIMKLRRTCQACPNYTITLTGDGTLTYEGGANARVQEQRSIRVDAGVVNAMLNEFVQSEFSELDNTYPSPADGHMTVSLSIEMNGLSKAVLSEDRYGPASLIELERKMDDLPGMRALSGWTH
jgi:hypothetical protein